MKATRMRRGAISLSMASHLPVTLGSYCITPVMLPPGRERLAMKPEPTGSARAANTMGISWLSRCSAATAGVVIAKITSGPQCNELFREHLCLSADQRKAIVDVKIAVLRPSPLCKSLQESGDPRFRFRIVLGQGDSDTDPPH